MAKKFQFRGIDGEQLKNVEMNAFVDMVDSRMRRTLKRGFTFQQKKLLREIKKFKEQGNTKPIKTHCRDMPIIPEMIGVSFMVHTGKEFVIVNVNEEMLGHYLGEFAPTRKRIQHSAPGVGATRSSKFVPLK